VLHYILLVENIINALSPFTLLHTTAHFTTLNCLHQASQTQNAPTNYQEPNETI